jgi:hypothetical protein
LILSGLGLFLTITWTRTSSNKFLMGKYYRMYKRTVLVLLKLCIVFSARLTVVMDCVRSGKGLGLPYGWSLYNGWEQEEEANLTPGDVVFIGCVTNESVCDTDFMYKTSSGALTSSLCKVLKDHPTPAHDALLQSLHKSMKDLRTDWKPQLSTSQRFDIATPFIMNEARPNRNSYITTQFVPTVTHPIPQDARLAELIGVTGSALIVGDIDLE